MADKSDPGWTELDEGRAKTGGRTSGVGSAKGTGVSKWSLLLLVLAILLAIILGQNTDRVEVTVLWAEFEAPLFLVVLLTGLGLTVLWEVATLVLRHRRRQARAG